MATCWINGEFVNREDAKISVFDHGLLYGDGVFEGIRFYQKRAFRMQQHLERLFDSAQAICLSIPYHLEALKQAVNTAIQTSPLDDGYIRLIITRGEGALGIDPRSCSQGNSIIIVDELKMVAEQILQQGAKVIISSTRRLPSDGLDPRIKSLNYLNHIQARIEANYCQADEAILLNQQGLITEGTTDNVFMVKNRQLITPPVSDGVLNGITRLEILQIAEQIGIQAAEKSLVPYDLYTADSLFLTGTAAELIPVREIDGRVLPQCPGEIFLKLQEAFQQTVNHVPNNDGE